MCKSGPSKYGSDTNKLRRVTFFSLTFPQLLTEFQCSVRLGTMGDTCYFELFVTLHKYAVKATLGTAYR